MILLVKIKKVSFILWEKTKWTFWPTQYKVINIMLLRNFQCFRKMLMMEL